jgi:hypothetical protein
MYLQAHSQAQRWWQLALSVCVPHHACTHMNLVVASASVLQKRMELVSLAPLQGVKVLEEKEGPL